MYDAAMPEICRIWHVNQPFISSRFLTFRQAVNHQLDYCNSRGDRPSRSSRSWFLCLGSNFLVSGSTSCRLPKVTLPGGRVRREAEMFCCSTGLACSMILGLTGNLHKKMQCLKVWINFVWHNIMYHNPARQNGDFGAEFRLFST